MRRLDSRRLTGPNFHLAGPAAIAEVVGDDDLTGGDFVRTTKQLIDLLRQLAIVAPNPSTRRAAAQAAEAAFRGVVADSAAPTPISTPSPAASTT